MLYNFIYYQKQIFTSLLLAYLKIPSSVRVNVYDLTNGQMEQLIQLFGQNQQYQQFKAIYHTGTIVYDREYYYGGSMDPQITDGIFNDVPGKTQYGTPIKTIDFGSTDKTLEEIEQYVQNQNKGDFTAQKYDPLEHNCNTFTNEFINFLNGSQLNEEYRDQGKKFKNTDLGKLYQQFMGNNSQQLFQNQAPQIVSQPKQQEPEKKQKKSSPKEVIDQKYKDLYIQFPKVFYQNKDELKQLTESNYALKQVYEASMNQQDILIQDDQLQQFYQEQKLSTLQKYEIQSLLCTTSCWQLIRSNESPIYLIVQNNSGIKYTQFLFYLTNYLSQICGMKQARENYQQVYQYIIQMTNSQTEQLCALRAYYNFSRILKPEMIKKLNPYDSLLSLITNFTQQIQDGKQKQFQACLNLTCAIYGRLLITLSQTDSIIEYKAKINSSNLPSLKNTNIPAVKQLLKYCTIVERQDIQNVDEFY